LAWSLTITNGPTKGNFVRKKRKQTGAERGMKTREKGCLWENNTDTTGAGQKMAGRSQRANGCMSEKQARISNICVPAQVSGPKSKRQTSEGGGNHLVKEPPCRKKNLKRKNKKPTDKKRAKGGGWGSKNKLTVSHDVKRPL